MTSINQTNSTVSPLDDQVLDAIGYYLIVCFCLCVLSNSVLLIVFVRHKELRVPLNLFTISVSVCNLVSAIQFPFIIDSSFSHRYVASLSKLSTHFVYLCVNC